MNTIPFDPDKLRQLAKVETYAPGAGAPLKRFKIEPFHEIKAGSEPEWLIDNVLPASGLGVIYGAPGSGKSFVTQDAVLAIARGEPWGGRTTMQAPVIYISAEGARGFRKRTEAYRQEHRLDSQRIPFGLIADAPNLGCDQGDIETLVGAIRMQIPELGSAPKLIVIDTLSRCMFGADESSAADMGVFITNAQKLEAAFDCLVLVVHHSGKDIERGPRGSNSLKGAADVELQVSDGNGRRLVEITKQKDGEGDQELTFKLRPVELDDDRSSCVVEILSQWRFSDGQTKARKRAPTARMKHLLNCVREALAAHSENAPSNLELPAGTMVVSRDRIREEAIRAGFANSDPEQKGQSSTWRNAFANGLSDLTGGTYIAQRDGWVWMTP